MIPKEELQVLEEFNFSIPLMVKEIISLRKDQAFILCDDELPKQGENVITYDPYTGIIEEGWMVYTKGEPSYWETYSQKDDCNITMWKRFPDKPGRVQHDTQVQR